MNYRENLKNKKRIVVKIGSSSLQHAETGDLDYVLIDTLARELSNLKNQGKDVVLVTSGAVAAGRKAIGHSREQKASVPQRQAYAAIGQARLMMTYQRLFLEYNQNCAQILMTMNTILDDINRINAQNAFAELFHFGAIPVVNNNDTIITYELEQLTRVADNDTLSAVVCALTGADLLILLSDVDGLYTDNPKENANATFIPFVHRLDGSILSMGTKQTGSSVGTGGMNSKLVAAKIATSAGADMIIADGSDARILHRIMDGREYGTLFCADKNDDFDLSSFVREMN